MAQRLLRAYDEIRDGTQCHRKTYITTAFGGLIGAIGSAYSVVLNPADTHLEAVAGLAGTRSLQLLLELCLASPPVSVPRSVRSQMTP